MVILGVSYCYLIARLSTDVVSLYTVCTVVPISNYFYDDLIVLHMVEPGQTTRLNKNATHGRTSARHVNWLGHNTWAIKIQHVQENREDKNTACGWTIVMCGQIRNGHVD
jgi:hypothetical protein